MPFQLERKHGLKIAVFLIVILAIVCIGLFTDVSRHLSPENLKGYLALAGPYAPILFITAFIAGFFLRIPGFIFIILGVIVFKRLPAIVYSFIAITLGTSLTFLIARFFLHDTVARIEIRGVKNLNEKAAQRGFLTVLCLRLIFFLIPPLNWVLGVTKVKYRDYLFGTMLGVAPGVLIIALVFGDIKNLNLSTGIRDYRLFLPSLIGIILLVLFVCSKRYIKKWFNRGTTS